MRDAERPAFGTWHLKTSAGERTNNEKNAQSTIVNAFEFLWVLNHFFGLKLAPSYIMTTELPFYLLQRLILIIFLLVVSPNSSQAIENQCYNLFNMSPMGLEGLSKSISWQEGADFADNWVKKRMNGKFKVSDYDPRVMEVERFAQESNLNGFDIAGLGAGEFFISRSSVEELFRILDDQEFARGFTEKIIQLVRGRKMLRWYFSRFEKGEVKRPISVDLFQRATRIFFAYKYIMTLPQSEKSYTIEEFTKIAEIEGLKPENFRELYRIDSRDPSEIIQANGFSPHPKKAKGILTEHSRQGAGAQGSGFVSTTLQPGNEFNLRVWPVVESAKVFSTDAKVAAKMFKRRKNDFSRNTDKLLEGLKIPRGSDVVNSSPGSFHLEILMTNEYSITDTFGVKPASDTSIAEEKEVVTPFILLDHIQKFRSIHILALVKRDKSGILEEFHYIDSKLGRWTKLK